MSKEKDYIESIKGAERRFLTRPVSIEKRAEGEGEAAVEFAVIEGEAAVIGERADIGWFTEEILPGAFDEVLNNDVRCLFNHDPNYILARSVNGKGTLDLFLEGNALKYRYTTPDISYAKDLQVSIDRGDVSQSSFAFRIEKQNWVEVEGQPDHREIVKFSELYDVSPVTYPAYQNTTVAKRSHDAFLEANKPAPAADTDTSEEGVFTVRDAQLIINNNK